MGDRVSQVAAFFWLSQSEEYSPLEFHRFESGKINADGSIPSPTASSQNTAHEHWKYICVPVKYNLLLGVFLLGTSKLD